MAMIKDCFIHYFVDPVSLAELDVKVLSFYHAFFAKSAGSESIRGSLCPSIYPHVVCPK